MQAAVLEQLIDARAAGRAAVLITPLGAQLAVPQRLWEARDLQDAARELPDVLRSAALAALREDRARTLEHQGTQVFVQPFNPPLRLVIVGAVHIAESLAALAVHSDYRVSVIEPRAAFARPARFPDARVIEDWPRQGLALLSPDARTAIVTLTHDPKVDDPALLASLASPAFYVGALGSKRTHAKRLERLAAAGASAADLRRIHGPAGLAIGARSPGEIAVSILAQMTAVLRSPAETTAETKAQPL